ICSRDCSSDVCSSDLAYPDHVRRRVGAREVAGLDGAIEAGRRWLEESLTELLSLPFTEAPSWYTFSGWRIGISPAVTWRLVLNGRIDADLTAVTLSSAAIAGSGLIRLGTPPA